MTPAWRDLVGLVALVFLALERGGEEKAGSLKISDLGLLLALVAGFPGGIPENILGPLIALLLAGGLGTLILVRAPSWAWLKDPVPALSAAAALCLAWSALLTASPSSEAEGLLQSLPGVLGLASGGAGLGLALAPARGQKSLRTLAIFPGLLALIFSAWYCGRPEDGWALAVIAVLSGLATHLLGRSLDLGRQPGLRPLVCLASGLALAFAGLVLGFSLLCGAGALSAGRALKQFRSPAIPA